MNIRIILAATLTAATLALPASAADPTPPPKANPYVCLRHADVNGWGARDDHSMVVDDRFGSKYLVSLRGLCSDLKFSLGAGFTGPGRMGIVGSCVDRGDRVVMRDGGFGVENKTCWVTKVQRYTKEMQMADKLAREQKQPLAAY